MCTTMPPEQITEDLFRIRVPLPGNPLKELNSYFIKGPDRNLLIDTGFNQNECREALMHGLADLHADMENTDIFLTHLHSDHCGLAPLFIREGRKIYISETDKKWIDDDEFVSYGWDSIYQRMSACGIPADTMDAMFDFNPAIDYAPESKLVTYDSVRDGDFIDVGRYHFQCKLMPGHTPGLMCLWEEAYRIMILGDHVLFDITPNITFWPDIEDSLGDYLESLHRVESMDVRLALPGHRETGDFSQRIKELLQHHEIRLEECREAMRKKPDITAYEVASQITWNIRRRSWETFPASQLFFAMGECQAHLDYLMKRDEVSAQMGEDGIIRYRLG